MLSYLRPGGGGGLVGDSLIGIAETKVDEARNVRAIVCG
jgi:hypothetical protein